MIHLSVMDSGNLGIVTVQGSITGPVVEELRAHLTRALRAVNRVVLNVENITGVDLACLQLLCSAHRSALQANKSVTVAGIRAEIFNRTVRTAAYTRCACCTQDRDSGCLWKLAG